MFPETLNEGFGEYVLKVKKEIKGSVSSEEEAVSNLSVLIKEAVDKRANNKIGVAFSGGVDSSLIALICSNMDKNFKLYTVGLKGSKDIEYAKKVASKYGWNLKIKVTSLEELEKTLKILVNIVERDIISISVGAVVYFILEMAKEDNVDLVLGGLGSEEIFAGYKRHKDKEVEEVNEECWRGLQNLWFRDLKRDTLIAKCFGVKVLCPYLDDNLIKYAMIIDPKLKIKNNDLKYILRKTAVSLGLDKEFAFRKKLAAQYGSNFVKAIDKLAKKNGFRYKKDYLESL